MQPRLVERRVARSGPEIAPKGRVTILFLKRLKRSVVHGFHEASDLLRAVSGAYERSAL